MFKRRTGSSLQRILIACVAACAFTLSAPAARGDSAQAEFDIPAQALASALLKFSEQAGVQVSVSTTAVDGLSTTGIRGKLTPEAALSALLANTGLKFRAIGRKTYSVAQPEAEPKPLSRSRSGRADTGGTLRLVSAQVEDTAAPVPNAGSTADEAPEKGVPEILVKGARSSNTDIVRTEDDVQPYVVFGAEDIEQSMTANLNEFLKTRLPMNSVHMSNAQGAGSLRGNNSSIDLRGMGADQTLILVNGRRMPGIAYQGQDFEQPDINGIPLSAVERIEILPSTAGGIYGGGATGGVINIILKSNYQGFELTARYDNTFQSDVAQRRVEGNAGFSLEDGRTHVMLSGSYSDANTLRVGERDFMSRARALMLRNDPAAFYAPPTGGNPPIGATPNIRSANGQPLVLKYQNTPLNSLMAHVPYGYGGIATDNGLAFLGTAGAQNLDLPRGLNGIDSTFMIVPEVTSAALNARRTFTDRIEAFLDATYMKNESTSHSGFTPTSLTLGPGAASNPFQQPIVVTLAHTGLTHGSAMSNFSETLGATGGVIVRLPRQWNLQAEYAWSRSQFGYAFTTQRMNGQGMGALFGGGMDILRDDVAHPLDYPAEFLFTPSPNFTQLDPFETVLTDATVRVAGPTVDLPGGAVILSAMLERREQESQTTVTINHVQPTLAMYGYVPARGQTTDSAYIEATAPLISARNAGRFARALEVQASYRHDSTSTRTVADAALGQITIPGPVFTAPGFIPPDIAYDESTVDADQYTLGLRYQPVEAAALRLSYGAGVLPPSVAQLVPRLQQNWNVFGVTDPWRRDGAGNPTAVGVVENYNIAGFAGLRPEESSSWSAGMIFTPASLSGLRISLDYLRLKKKDEIANLDSQLLVNLEDAFPGRIVRKALTEADILAGYERGEIETFDNGLVNIAHTNVEAVDFQIDYRWNTSFGAFRANLLGSRQLHLEQQPLEGTPIYDSVGYLFGPVPWKANGGLTFHREGWTVAWNAQYFDSQRVYDVTSTPESRATTVLRQGADSIPHQVYHDVFVKYRIDAAAGGFGGLLANSDLSIGISNLFDKTPPIMTNFLTTSVGAAGYSFYGNPLMRRYSLSLSKRF